ncbi:hypothetical protein KM043_016591 [Ampulex compressa]|nr:hypothetical protein KM043_016591 [Ampulex compressa]
MALPTDKGSTNITYPCVKEPETTSLAAEWRFGWPTLCHPAIGCEVVHPREIFSIHSGNQMQVRQDEKATQRRRTCSLRFQRGDDPFDVVCELSLSIKAPTEWDRINQLVIPHLSHGNFNSAPTSMRCVAQNSKAPKANQLGT